MSVTRCQQLKTDLTAARQALTDKRLGAQPLQVQTGSEMTRFAGSSVAAIQAEIADLESEFKSLNCPVLLGEAPTETLRPRRRGPLRGPVGRR